MLKSALVLDGLFCLAPLRSPNNQAISTVAVPEVLLQRLTRLRIAGRVLRSIISECVPALALMWLAISHVSTSERV